MADNQATKSDLESSATAFTVWPLLIDKYSVKKKVKIEFEKPIKAYISSIMCGEGANQSIFNNNGTKLSDLLIVYK